MTPTPKDRRESPSADFVTVSDAKLDCEAFVPSPIPSGEPGRLLCVAYDRLKDINADLLAACEESVKLLRAASDYMNTVANNQDARWLYHEAVQTVSAAIAKARGESTKKEG